MSSPRLWRLIATTSLVLFPLALAGCGQQEPSNVVHFSGTVTFAGKPIPMGMIIFEPDPSRGNSGSQGHADIKDGKFDTRLSKKGVAAGAQIVRITGGDGVNPEPFTPFGNLLFEEHNIRAVLSREQSTLQFDVPGLGSKAKGK